MQGRQGKSNPGFTVTGLFHLICLHFDLDLIGLPHRPSKGATQIKSKQYGGVLRSEDYAQFNSSYYLIQYKLL